MCAATVTDKDKVGEFEWWMVPVDKKVEKEEEILGMDGVAMLVEGIRKAVIRYSNGTVCGGGYAAGEMLMIAFVLAGLPVCEGRMCWTKEHTHERQAPPWTKTMRSGCSAAYRSNWCRPSSPYENKDDTIFNDVSLPWRCIKSSAHFAWNHHHHGLYCLRHLQSRFPLFFTSSSLISVLDPPCHLPASRWCLSRERLPRRFRKCHSPVITCWLLIYPPKFINILLTILGYMCVLLLIHFQPPNLLVLLVRESFMVGMSHPLFLSTLIFCLQRCTLF